MTTASDPKATVDGMGLFPDENPHPVLRMAADARLLYANRASEPIRLALGCQVGGFVPEETARALRAAAREVPPGTVEVAHGGRSYDVLSIYVAQLDAYNLYGTDITAEKVVERFPADNPNPVLRMTPAGEVRYANEASGPIISALGMAVGDRLPPELLDQLAGCLANPTEPPPEIPGAGGLTFRLKPVAVPEFEFVNLYGTDITAEKAVDRFPNQNPHPVLRLTRAGRMTYANPASALVRRALGAEVGEDLAEDVFATVLAAAEKELDPTFEVDVEGAIYSIRVVHVDEFDSVNLYGTDITAARRVEELSQANEALLLNILPPSIAERLRGGEMVIADRFEGMAVLFADVVGFTELSSQLAPSDVVSLLNDVFSACDRLADRFRLEKIKTVGDAYMVAGGLHTVYGEDQAEHAGDAGDVAEMGLAIIDEIGRLGGARGMPIQIRVGMHVGPAVAGVIGLKKFTYDIWGDTVNTASRMESTGVAGRVQVTRATIDRLGDGYEFERRGFVEVKGKGDVETWFLVGRRAA